MASTLGMTLRSDPAALLEPISSLSPLGDRGRKHVLEEGQIVHLLPGARVSEAKAYREETHYVVVAGELAAGERPASQGPVRLKIVGGAPQHDIHFSLPLGPGDVFSDAYLFSAGSPRVDVVAVMESALLAVPRSRLHDLFQQYPEWSRRLADQSASLQRKLQLGRPHDSATAQDFRLRHHYSFATTMKVIDLSRCLGCDGCERACASRHGEKRLTRKGPVLGEMSFPVACRTCEDHRCLDACGFDALAMKDHELVINPRKCVGCRGCYDACPNGVIEMVERPYTVEDFPNPLPSTDSHGQTNVPGLFLAGEAAGAALIKVAMNGGVIAVRKVAEEVPPGSGGQDTLDAVVVGAGPSGLGAALECKEQGLNFLVFDKGHFAETIQSYPREKVVMAEPAHVPKYGKLWLENTTKEELIGKWAEIIEKTGLEIRSNEPVASVERQADGVFTVKTSKGTYRTLRVVLCVGNRGSPRKLKVSGETPERVLYVLTDPEPYAGQKVLVVGGGDSAVEAAMSLADFGAEVSISYRKDRFGRIKAGNRDRLDFYSAKGKVRLLMSSTVKELTDGFAILNVENGEETITNELVFAMLGAEPPTKFFKAAGIEILEPGSEAMAELAQARGSREQANKCDHCVGYEDQACIQACPTGAIMELKAEQVFGPRHGLATTADSIHDVLKRSSSRRGSRVFTFLGVVLALVILGAGLESFLRAVLPNQSLTARFTSEANIGFTAGQGLGFWLGIVGTALMVFATLYPLTSRTRALAGIARTRVFFFAHIAAGLVGPAFVTYHTMLKVNRWPSIAFWAMWAVVLSGLVGRHVATFLRARIGRLSTSRSGAGRFARLVGALLRGAEAVLGRWRWVHAGLTVVMFIVAALHIVVALQYRAGGLG